MKNKYLSFVLFLVVTILIIFSTNTKLLYAETDKPIFENFSSKSYILLDSNSGMILASLNENQKLPVASICKLMTSLIVLESIENNTIGLDDELIASPYACSVEGSQAFLDAGSKYSVKDLLKSVIVASANDSAIVLAEGVAGNENEFVKMMNKKAEELGMKNTLYQNSTGLNTMDQHSTAFDTAIILKEISKYELYESDCKIWMDKLMHPSGRETELVNTNRLIRYYNYCLGGKTGYTDEAGYCLSSIASNDNLKLIAVTLNCKDSASRFSESVELFNYGFANFENTKVLDKSKPLDKFINVIGGKNESAEVYFADDFYAINNKYDKSIYETKIEMNDSVKAPKMAGEKVGVVYVLKDGIVINETDLIINENLEKQDFSDIWFKISDKWALAN